MGTICFLTRDPRNWQILRSLGTSVQTHEEILSVSIGSVNYDYEGTSRWVIPIRKDVFEKLQNGIYSLSEINPYGEPPFEIQDENGVKIERIGMWIY